MLHNRDEFRFSDPAAVEWSHLENKSGTDIFSCQRALIGGFSREYAGIPVFANSVLSQQLAPLSANLLTEAISRWQISSQDLGIEVRRSGSFVESGVGDERSIVTWYQCHHRSDGTCLIPLGPTEILLDGDPDGCTDQDNVGLEVLSLPVLISFEFYPAQNYAYFKVKFPCGHYDKEVLKDNFDAINRQYISELCTSFCLCISEDQPIYKGLFRRGSLLAKRVDGFLQGHLYQKAESLSKDGYFDDDLVIEYSRAFSKNGGARIISASIFDSDVLLFDSDRSPFIIRLRLPYIGPENFHLWREGEVFEGQFVELKIQPYFDHYGQLCVREAPRN